MQVRIRMLLLMAASTLSLQCDPTPEIARTRPPLCDDVVALDNLGHDPYSLTPAELKKMGASRGELVQRLRNKVPDWDANLSVLQHATQQLQHGDLSPLDDPTAIDSLRQVRYAAAEHCRFATVGIIATDLRYDVPPRVAAGRTLIEVDNRGTNTHVFMLLRSGQGAEGTPLERAVAFMRSHGSSGATPVRLAGDPGPVTPPRDTDAHLYRLDRGAYVWFCPLHATKGMVGELIVR